MDLTGNVQVDPHTVLQFLGSRCSQHQQFTTSPGEISLMDDLAPAAPPLPGNIPFTVYYRPTNAPEMYDVGSGNLSSTATITLADSGTYYVVFFDTLSPTLLQYNPQTGTGNLLVSCVLHLPFPPSAGY